MTYPDQTYPAQRNASPQDTYHWPAIPIVACIWLSPEPYPVYRDEATTPLPTALVAQRNFPS